jgi:cytoskeleton protein RodZ
MMDGGPQLSEEPAATRSAGAALRRRREALNLGLGDIAAALKIKLAYLSALEAGRLDLLPGRAYAFGFLRAYADHLGLDPDEIARRFKQETPAFAERPNLSLPMPLGERSIPGVGTLLVAIILAICGYGTWYYLATVEPSHRPRVAAVPLELLGPQSGSSAAGPLPSPLPTGGSGQPHAVAGVEVSVLSGGESAAPDPDAGSTVPLTSNSMPALPSTVAFANLASAAAPALRAEEEPSPVSPLPSSSTTPIGTSPRIVIRAATNSWVEIRDAGSSPLLMRVLKAGESYTVPDRPGLIMRTGNAGGLEITVDGNPVPPIGRPGAVRRNVALDPQALMSRTAVRD